MGCTTYPEIPARAPVPSRAMQHDDFAWNAGANSIDELDGDVRCAFTMGRVVGVVVGFTADRDGVGDRARLMHALAFGQNANGDMIVSVMEAGKNKTAAAGYDSVDTFELRRIASTVTYRKNGVVFYTARATSAGMVSVGCAIYATGDSAP